MAKQPNMDAERAAFESVMPEAYPRCRNMPDKSYNSPQLYERWIGWQACVEYHSLRAAPMGEELPALLDQVADDIEPVAAFTPNGRAVKWHPSYQASEGYTTLYTAEQVRQAQMDAIAPYAERIRQLERELAERRPRVALDPELKAALEEAAKTRSTVALLPDGEPVFINYGDQPEDTSDLCCTACGGSGHIDDQKGIASRVAPAAGTEKDAEWISVNDRLPPAGARVLVSRYAGRVNGPEHPGYPGVPWVEVSSMYQDAGFVCDLVTTGYVTHWKPVEAAAIEAGAPSCGS
jgi:hypothetical protein